jgi:hypothetical protein
MKGKTEDQYFIFDNPSPSFPARFKAWVKCKILSPTYKFLMLIAKKKNPPSRQYTVSICAIFKNEAPYLKEWIIYHQIVGIKHFYLYNNNSTDNFQEVLKPFLSEGLVTLIDWPLCPGQMPAYEDCVKRYSRETEWISFVDIDEFIVPQKSNDVYDVLKNFKNRAFVVAYWHIFGSSGIVSRNISSPVIKDFVISTKKPMNIGKCFYNTSFDYCPSYQDKGKMHFMHSRWFQINIPPVNTLDYLCEVNYNQGKKGGFPLGINHYVTKSYDEFVSAKSKKGDAIFGNDRIRTMDYFFDHNSLCDSPNYSAYRFLPKLLENLTTNNPALSKGKSNERKTHGITTK